MSKAQNLGLAYCCHHFQLIPNRQLPGRESPEWEAYDKARNAHDKAWAAYDKAWAAYIAKYQPELDALHDRLFPDCPWDGTTIFGGGPNVTRAV